MLTCVTTLMKFEDITLGKTYQLQKDNYCMTHSISVTVCKCIEQIIEQSLPGTGVEGGNRHSFSSLRQKKKKLDSASTVCQCEYIYYQ